MTCGTIGLIASCSMNHFEKNMVCFVDIQISDNMVTS
jgi:hypothetical protein